MFKKNNFALIALLMVGLMPTASSSFALPQALHNASIAARQRAQFAKVMVGALWKHARGQHQQLS